MTWNIRSGAGGDDAAPGLDRVENLSRIAEVIRDADVDIVGLQEVDRYQKRSGGVDQAQVIGNAIGIQAVFVANWLPEGGARSERVPQYGVALLSRWPVVDARHVLHRTPHGWEPRGTLVATLRLPNGETLDVANTHLQVDRPGQPGSARDQRAIGLRRTIEAVTTPAVVMGDFNALPGSPELAVIESRWMDTWRASHANDPGRTFPARKEGEPAQRIDYLFASEGIDVLGAEVCIDDRTRVVSDHYPVMVDLEIV